MQSPRQTSDAPVYEQLTRNPGSQRDICPAAGSRQRPSAKRPADPGGRPAARGCAGPGQIAVPDHSAARWRIRRRRTIRTLSEHRRAHPAQPSITTAPGLAGRADRTTHSNEKRLLSNSKSHRAPNICVFLGVTTMGPYARRSYCYAPYLVSVPLCRQLSDPLKF
jgi:hypothetical protein